MLLLVYAKFKDFAMLEHPLAPTSTRCRAPGIRNLQPLVGLSWFLCPECRRGPPCSMASVPSPDASAPTISTSLFLAGLLLPPAAPLAHLMSHICSYFLAGCIKKPDSQIHLLYAFQFIDFPLVSPIYLVFQSSSYNTCA